MLRQFGRWHTICMSISRWSKTCVLDWMFEKSQAGHGIRIRREHVCPCYTKEGETNTRVLCGKLQAMQVQGANLPRIATPQSRSKVDQRKFYWLLGVLLVCLVPLCFLGYGSDSDTYAVLRCGTSTWHDHNPCMSRNPGYWMYEAIAYALSTLGGYALSNLASLVIATVVLCRFRRFASSLGMRNVILLTACLAVTPVVTIAATSTMDYLWSLLFIVFCAEMLLAERLVAASILGGLAISFRGSNSVVVGSGFTALVLHELIRQQRITKGAIRMAVSGIFAAGLGMLPFLASYKVAGNSMSFLTPLMGDPTAWTWKLRLGKFAYKSVYAFGPAAMLVLMIAYLLNVKRLHSNGISSGNAAPIGSSLNLTVLSRGYVLGNLLLYLSFPIEISYLIPGIFFFLLLAGEYFRFSTTMLIIFFCSILSLNFVLPQFARPNIPEAATAASLSFQLVPGTLIQDIQARRQLIGCLDVNCWKQRKALPPHQ